MTTTRKSLQLCAMLLGSLATAGAAYAAPTAPAVSPTSKNFGNVSVANIVPVQTFTVKNNQNAVLPILSITSGPEFPQTNDGVTQLAARAQCTISVRFAPAAMGNRTATLSVRYDNSAAPVVSALSGTGTTPVSQATSLAFNNVPVGTPSVAKTVSITNNQAVPLAISSIVVDGDLRPDEQLSDQPGVAGDLHGHRDLHPDEDRAEGRRAHRHTQRHHDAAADRPHRNRRDDRSRVGRGHSGQSVSGARSDSPVQRHRHLQQQHDKGFDVRHHLVVGIARQSHDFRYRPRYERCAGDERHQRERERHRRVDDPDRRGQGAGVDCRHAGRAVDFSGQTQQFTATGTYTDGSTQTLTSSVTWSSGTPATASISPSGLATSAAAGRRRSRRRRAPSADRPV